MDCLIINLLFNINLTVTDTGYAAKALCSMSDGRATGQDEILHADLQV